MNAMQAVWAIDLGESMMCTLITGNGKKTARVYLHTGTVGKTGQQ